jgi:hypothetical protein
MKAGEQKDGGQAFPRPFEGATGMTLRDYFAAAALTGLIASNDEGAGDRLTEIPEYAYQIADAMLKERSK